jgi:acyl-CoA synthetase (AMP-forming)/AMP-acid ligase II
MSCANSWFDSKFGAFLDRPAIMSSQGRLTFGELSDQVGEWQRLFIRTNIRPHAVVAIRGLHCQSTIAAFIALIKNGNVVAPLPDSSPDASGLLEIVGAEAFLDIADDGTWDLNLLSKGKRYSRLVNFQKSQRPGLIVLTSGTTGKVKAALFDLQTVLMRYEGACRPLRTLVFLGIDHLGGVNTLLHTFGSGGAVILSRDREAEAICRQIAEHGVELLPTTPTFLRMLVVSGAYRRHDLSSLRLVTYGTEPMPAQTLIHLCKILPHVRFKQTYGLSELGVLPTKSRSSESLWLKLGGIGCETQIRDGVLWVRSNTPMLGYLNAPDPFDEAGWYNTGDLVEQDGEFIRILGRSSDVINVGGEKVLPTEVEEVLLKMDNVADVSVWGDRNPVTGQIVAARISVTVPEDAKSLAMRVHAFCRDKLPDHKIPAVIELAAEALHGERFKKVRRSEPAVSVRHGAMVEAINERSEK